VGGGRVTRFDTVILSKRWQDNIIDMEDDRIDMEDKKNMTVSIWEMAVSIRNIVSLCCGGRRQAEGITF
jgi:hypothetical protein